MSSLLVNIDKRFTSSPCGVQLHDLSFSTISAIVRRELRNRCIVLVAIRESRVKWLTMKHLMNSGSSCRRGFDGTGHSAKNK